MDINELVQAFRPEEKSNRRNKKQKRVKGENPRIDKARVEEMNRLRFVEKMTLQEIADKYQLSRERVRQIIGNTGAGYKFRRRIKIALNHPELTNSQISEQLGVNYKTVSTYRSRQRHAIEDGFVKKGVDSEERVSEKLNNLGIEHKLMPLQHPFDIQLANGKRIDVKSAYKKMHPKSQRYDYYSFGIEKTRRGNYADFFILYIVPEDLCLVVPFEYAPKEMIHINTPIYSKGKFARFINNFDLLR